MSSTIPIASACPCTAANIKAVEQRVCQRLQEILDRTKSESFLKIKGRRPIAAEAVRVPRDLARNAVDAKRLRSGADIYFVFPRLRDGTEMITLKDKKVEFVSQIGPLKGERKFRLKDMVYTGKLEL